MWTSLHQIAPQAASRLKLRDGLREGEIFTQWDKQIGKELGAIFIKKAKPLSFKDKTLVIDCLNSSWASEFNLRREKILTWLKEKLGQNKIERIKFIS